MKTWIIQSFPVPPDKGGSFRFGIVTAADEDAARTAVLKALEQQGLDIKELTLDEVGLTEWFDGLNLYGKCLLLNG